MREKTLSNVEETVARGANVIAVDADRVDTNIVIFDVRGTGITGEEFGHRTLERFGVRFSVLGPTLVRAVTHLDLPPDVVDRALSAARAALRG